MKEPGENLNPQQDQTAYNPNQKRRKLTSNAFGKRIVVIIVLTIFISELLVMIIGNALSLEKFWVEAIADSLLLAIIIFLTIYFLVLRPLNNQINEWAITAEALKKNDQLLNSHINNSPLGTIEWDSNLIVTRWSGEAEKIFGWTRDETIGKSIINLKMIYDEDIPVVNRRIQQILEGSSKYIVAVNRNCTKDGRVILCEWYNSVLFDQNGKLISVMSQVMDVTERKNIEEMLRKSEESLNEAQRIAKIGSWEWDMISGKVNWSKGMFHVFDIDSNQFDGNPNAILKVIHPDDIERFIDSMKSNLSSGSSPTLVYRVIHKDGSVHTIQAEGRNYFNDAGIPIKNIGTAQDITELKKEKDALSESEKKYRMMFQNLTVAFALHEIILDAKGKPCDYRFLELNPAFESLTGFKSEDLIGKTTLEVLPKTEPFWIEIYGKVALKGKTVNFENYSGELGRYYQVTAYSPEYGKFVTIFMDVTERKRSEQEKHLANEIHEKLLGHMTEIRENERALISREIHDQLGQSLTALKLDMNWLQTRASNTAEVNEKLQGMVDIIDTTIKDVQRISSELRPGILDDLGLAAAIEWYSEEFEKRSGLNVEMDLDEISIPDEKINLALFRIMQESMTNVIRHAKAKKIRIVLHEINEHIVLDIEDDGIGIPIEKLKSIQSLGLMSMHDRIKQVGGTLDILCDNETGTKLRICVPFKN